MPNYNSFLGIPFHINNRTYVNDILGLFKFFGFPIEFYVEESKEKEVTDSEEDAHGEVKRGTKFIFDLEEDQSEFLEARRLTDLAKKLSEFIGFPIVLHVEKSKEQGSDRFGEK